MDVVQLLSAAGIGGILGSLLTTFIQSWLSHKSYLANRNFQEKKDAYIGLLESYRIACLKSDNDARNKFAYWSVRCELVASKEIRNLIEKMKTQNADQQADAFIRLKELIRKDLGILGTDK